MNDGRGRQSGRILVVEDDESIALGLRMNLEGEGHMVEHAKDGAIGREQLRVGRWDLVIMDVMLPEANGYELIKELRGRGDRTPVLMLSARGAEMDKVLGLELGADDYVTKPFGLAELLARVRAALRRGTALQETPRLVFGEIEVDIQRREVRRAAGVVDLTAKEFDLLVVLIKSEGRVLTRRDIFKAVWGPNHHGTPRTIDNFVHELRTKLEVDAANPRHILTVRGVGYRFALGA